MIISIGTGNEYKNIKWKLTVLAQVVVPLDETKLFNYFSLTENIQLNECPFTGNLSYVIIQETLSEFLLQNGSSFTPK